MQVKFTIESNYELRVKKFIQKLLDYSIDLNQDDIIEACESGVLAIESGIMHFAKCNGINITQENGKTRNIRKVIKDARSSNLGYYFTEDFDLMIQLRNDLIQRNGRFDDDETIQILINIFTIFNIILPVQYRMHKIIEEIELQDHYIELSRKFSTQTYITGYSELRASNYKEAQYLPSDPGFCEECKNFSSQIFLNDDCEIHSCTLCGYDKKQYMCARCGNYHDINEESGCIIEAGEDGDELVYICAWCVNDYMEKG